MAFDGTAFVRLDEYPINQSNIKDKSEQEVFDYVVRRQWARLDAVPKGYTAALPAATRACLMLDSAGNFVTGGVMDLSPAYTPPESLNHLQRWRWNCAVGELMTDHEALVPVRDWGSNKGLADKLLHIHDSSSSSVAMARAEWPRMWRQLAADRELSPAVVEEVCRV